MGYAVQAQWRVLTKQDPPGAGTDKPLQYPCQENPMNRNKRLKEILLEDEPLRSEGIQHATEEKQRTSISSSRANKVVGPKPKGRSAVDAPGNEMKV